MEIELGHLNISEELAEKATNSNPHKSDKYSNKEKKKQKMKNKKPDPFEFVDQPDSDDQDIEKDFIKLISTELDMKQIKQKYETGEMIFFCDIPFEIDSKEIEQVHEWRVENIKMPLDDNQLITDGMTITNQLSKSFTSGTEFENVIKSFSNDLTQFDFKVLKKFIDEDKTFNSNLDILNGIAKLALELPTVLRKPLPLLKKNQTRTIFLSQKQIACLLANAFFCTFPERNDKIRNLPSFNFARLIKLSEYSIHATFHISVFFHPRTILNHLKIKAEKLKCIFNYFQNIINGVQLNGKISFERRCLSPEEVPDWSKSTKIMSKVTVQNSGRMEITGKDYSVVDFANRFIGGGVLNTGAVQEEIMFLICPELLVSRLFMESLSDNEAIVITGHSMSNSITGYSNTFKWTGTYYDHVEKDVLGRNNRQIIAIDAINFRKYKDGDQFEQKFLDRELNKAFVGFRNELGHCGSTAIATGKWGCGAYKGNPSLKYLIQLLAASEADRQLIFYTFRDKELSRSIKNFNRIISEKQVTVQQLYNLICNFKNSEPKNVFDFILAYLNQ